jgi:hypothetical protein
MSPKAIRLRRIRVGIALLYGTGLSCMCSAPVVPLAAVAPVVLGGLGMLSLAAAIDREHLGDHMV